MSTTNNITSQTQDSKLTKTKKHPRRNYLYGNINWIQNNNGEWIEYTGPTNLLRWEKGYPYWKLVVDKVPPIWVKGDDGFLIQEKAPCNPYNFFNIKE